MSVILQTLYKVDKRIFLRAICWFRTVAFVVILLDEECTGRDLAFIFPSTELSCGFFIVSNFR